MWAVVSTLLNAIGRCSSMDGWALGREAETPRHGVSAVFPTHPPSGHDALPFRLAGVFRIMTVGRVLAFQPMVKSAGPFLF